MKKIAFTLLATVLFSCGLTGGENQLKRIKSINCAKVLAQRNIVETVYGVKIRFLEEVVNIKDGNFMGTTESKTGKRSIKGIEFIEKYDPKNDIAQVTAVLKLKRIADIIDTSRFKLEQNPEKSIRRTAFASSTPETAKKIAALRAAELEAYKNLYKKIGGFTLESQSRVENFVLKSDRVKASVIGAILGAEYVGFSWMGKGNDAIAVVKLRLNLKELSEMLGEKIIDYDSDVVEAEGQAAIREGTPARKPDDPKQQRKVSTGVIETDIDMMP